MEPAIFESGRRSPESSRPIMLMGVWWRRTRIAPDMEETFTAAGLVSSSACMGEFAHSPVLMKASRTISDCATRIIIYDDKASVRDTYPVLAITMFVLLCCAPIGFIPDDFIDVPYWYRIYSCVVFVAFLVVGSKWYVILRYLLSRYAEYLARQTEYYEITIAEGLEFECNCIPGDFIIFYGIKRYFFKFEDNHDRVMFVLSRK